MGRPIAKGLTFFPMMCNHFSDRKVKRLIREYSGDGYMVYNYLLTMIYSDEGYFLKIDNSLYFDISDTLHIDESKVEKIISFCVNIGIFNSGKFKNRILTSADIQERYNYVVKTSKRRVDMKNELIINSEETPISSEETPISSEETPISSEETPISSELSAQTKQNKTKQHKTTQNNTKGGDILIFKDFLNDLHPHLEKWVTYMREKHGQDYSQLQLNTFCDKLMEKSGGNIELSKEMIDTAIIGNYKNVFELKKGKNNGTSGFNRDELRKFIKEIAETGN